MDITIEINTDNAAFEQNEGGETERILCKLAHKLARGITGNDSIPLMDINGNKVGSCETSPR